MVDREKLKQKYGDEEVLAIPLKTVQDLGLDNEGFTRVDPDSADDNITSLGIGSYYIPRWTSDENPEEVEIIPYISVKDFKGNYLMYKRVKNGDARGNGAYSLGIGGHINPVDDLLNPIVEGALREIREEIGVDIPESALVLLGFIRCKKTAYDLDHLAVCFELTIRDLDFSCCELQTMLPIGYINPNALALEFSEKLENWSKLLLGIN